MGWEHTLLCVWGLVVAAVDARNRRLPNLLTLGAALVGAAWLIEVQEGPLGTSPVSSLIAAALFLLFLAPGYARHWVGGGDVKLGITFGLLGGTKASLLTLGIGGLLLAALGWQAKRSRKPGDPPRVVPWGTAHGLAFAIAVVVLGYLPGDIY